MDLVVILDKCLKVGEMVFGMLFQIVLGGKGVNQVVVVVRFGVYVFMVGKVGDDYYGIVILDNLKVNGVCIDYMELVIYKESGIVYIVFVEGDNSIVVVKGVNDDIILLYVIDVFD